jgi:hypothetical protein
MPYYVHFLTSSTNFYSSSTKQQSHQFIDYYYIIQEWVEDSYFIEFNELQF